MISTKRNVVLFAAAATALLVCSIVYLNYDAAAVVAVGAAKMLVANVPVVAPAATLRSLLERRGDLISQMQGLLDAAEKEDRDLTAEEVAKFDQFKADKATLDKRISRLEETAAASEHASQARPSIASRAGIVHPPAPEAAREFENIGQFMHAVRFNPNDQRLHFVENAGANATDLSAEMRMDNNSQGGFMVPPQLRQTIMSVPAQDALVRPRANVIEAGSPPDAPVTMPALDQTGANPGNMYGGIEVKWIGEGEEKPETDAKLREVTLTPHEVAGFVTVTDKLLRNWQASGSFIEGLLRGGVSAAEDFAFLRGDGISKPLGAVNSGAMKFINRTTAGSFTYDDSVNMVARMLMRGGSAPVWSLPQSLLPKLATFQDPEGRYIWKSDARDGFAGTLHGYPVRWNNRSAGAGSKGDVVLADWSYYLIKDGSGPFVAASEHVLFKSNKTIIKIFWNVDGAPWLTAPIKEENGYEVSPFVGLDVPA